jgi:hypothetical protein
VDKESQEIKPWPFNGYAPGNYMNTCSICKTEMQGVDKLCFVCLECAVRISHKPAASSPSPSLREALEEIKKISDWEYESEDFKTLLRNVYKIAEAALASEGDGLRSVVQSVIDYMEENNKGQLNGMSPHEQQTIYNTLYRSINPTPPTVNQSK